jgi:hypothetical protein
MSEINKIDNKKKISESTSGKVTEAKGKAAGTADALKGKLEGGFANLKDGVGDLLKGLKDTLGIPDLPKLPKKPAFKELKKFEPKPAPEPKAFQKEEKKFEFAQAAPVKPPVPKPIVPKGKLSYKYEFVPGKKPRISVMFYEGNNYIDAIGALSFTTAVTEERAVELFIQSYKAGHPNLVSWGIQKL